MKYGSDEIHECKTVLQRVTAYGRKPRSAHAALVQARALLEEEGRWTQSSLVKIPKDQSALKEMYETSTCGSWSCCLAGAVQMVAGDIPIKICKITYLDEPDEEADYEIDETTAVNMEESDSDDPIYLAAMRCLIHAIAVRDKKNIPELDFMHEHVFSFNDDSGTTRTDVLSLLDEAIVISLTPIGRIR